MLFATVMPVVAVDTLYAEPAAGRESEAPELELIAKSSKNELWVCPASVTVAV